MLEVGDNAPDFTTTDDAGNTVHLHDFKGKTVVLYFYPKDDTTGCTKEACGFQSKLRTFSARGAMVIGVSPDSEKSHTKFKTKYDLKFPLLVDQDKTIANLYGVWKEKSMYGRKYMGIERTTFIIDPQGKIATIFPKVKVTDHIEQVLEALKSVA